MVVQRGDEERYQLLRKLFQSQRVEVVWDRRWRERRTAQPPTEDAERRSSERRASTPEDRFNLGFFVARRQARGSGDGPPSTGFGETSP